MLSDFRTKSSFYRKRNWGKNDAKISYGPKKDSGFELLRRCSFGRQEKNFLGLAGKIGRLFETS